MPLYEFRCKECKKLFEQLLTSSSQAALDAVECPGCGSKNVMKTISASSYRVSSGGSGIPGMPLAGCGTRGGFS